MADTVTSNIKASVDWLRITPLDLSNVTDSGGTASPPAYSKSLASGTAVDTADRVWADTRTLASAANDDLDLTALTATIFGSTVTVTMAKLKAIYIVHSSTTVGEKLNLDTSVANGLTAFTGSATGKVSVGADSVLLLTSKKDGWTIDATHKVLRITNAGSASAVYYIVLLGTSA